MRTGQTPRRPLPPSRAGPESKPEASTSLLADPIPRLLEALVHEVLRTAAAESLEIDEISESLATQFVVRDLYRALRARDADPPVFCTEKIMPDTVIARRFPHRAETLDSARVTTCCIPFSGADLGTQSGEKVSDRVETKPRSMVACNSCSLFLVRREKSRCAIWLRMQPKGTT